jgi:hypothetical protein
MSTPSQGPAGPPPQGTPSNWIDPSGWWWDGELWHPPGMPQSPGPLPPTAIPYAPLRQNKSFKTPVKVWGLLAVFIAAAILIPIVVVNASQSHAKKAASQSADSGGQTPPNTNDVAPAPTDNSGPAALPSFGQPGYCETTAPKDPACNLPVAPVETQSQSNAVTAAKAYLNYDAFSRTGLINQLQYEKFSAADATYAADTVSPDYNAQAARTAKKYLAYSSTFSHQSLVDQLVYDGYTSAQAEYGVSQVGL